jgi:hypothetical protein
VAVAVAVAVAWLAVIAAPRVAAAQDDVVAVLPLAASESHGMYAKPVADEIARELGSRSGVKVESLSLAGSVPARVALVIDGRIVDAGRRKVVLEARVRDPRRGAIMIDTVATKARAVGEIDVLAGELAGALAPRLKAAVDEQRRLAAAEAEAVKVVEPVKVTKGNPPPRPSPLRGEGDSRPAILVLRARAMPGDVETITREGMRVAERLGHRAIAGQETALVDPKALPGVIAAAGAVYALAIDVKDVRFDRRGEKKDVIMARGRARVVLYDRTGRAVFDRIARTGTLVGSRGDGQPALVHFVGEQIADIVYPYLRKLVGK